jgi:hypothetical protein
MAVKNYPVGTHISGPLKQGAKSMLLSTDVGGISAAKTLTADESNGQTYILDGGTGVVITLPVATKGWRCKFIVGATFATTDFVLTAQSAILNGSITEAGLVQLIAAATTINLELATAVIGDWVELESDGTSIFVKGQTSGATATPA